MYNILLHHFWHNFLSQWISPWHKYLMLFYFRSGSSFKEFIRLENDCQHDCPLECTEWIPFYLYVYKKLKWFSLGKWNAKDQPTFGRMKRKPQMICGVIFRVRENMVNIWWFLSRRQHILPSFSTFCSVVGNQPTNNHLFEFIFRIYARIYVYIRYVGWIVDVTELLMLGSRE